MTAIGSSASASIGRAASGLRVVRRRLALAMTAIAIVSVGLTVSLLVVILPIRGDQPRASADARVLAARLGGELDRTAATLRLAAAQPALRDVVMATPRAGSALAGQARASIEALATSGGPSLISISLLGPDGTVRLRWSRNGGAALPGKPAGAGAQAFLRAALAGASDELILSDPTWGPQGTILTAAVIIRPAKPANAAPGLLSMDLSLETLVERFASGLDNPRTVSLVDRGGRVVLSHELVRGSSLPGGAAPSTTVEAVSGATGLAVYQPGPAGGSALPIEIGGLLTGLVGALGLAALWLVGRILRPAEELEASRDSLAVAYEQARSDSLQDALTGLGNHRAFQEELHRQGEAAVRYGAPVSLLLLDLDDLKVVNDSAGHAVGDELLAAMGHRIGQTLRRPDRGFRIGGDEFAVIMPHTGPDGAFVVARRLLAAALQPSPADTFGRPFSFSGGISTYPDLAPDSRQLYAQADGALYWCKRHGRTSVEVFDAARHRSDGDHGTEAELSAAVVKLVERRAIRAVYQPIVELSSGRILGYEGLVRPLPDAGFESAGALFRAAEETGRTFELDQACIEAVIAGAGSIAEDRYVSLNLSPRTIEAPEFNPRALLTNLGRNRIPPHRLIIELTEREEVEDMERLKRNLASLQVAGARIAADDVGSGNAGLRLLSQVHFDIVKIDLSLVQGGGSRDPSYDVLASLRDLAGRWGALVVAEGIEAAEQLRFVRNLGVTAGQGYLLGRPSEKTDHGRVDLDELVAREEILGRRSVPIGVG